MTRVLVVGRGRLGSSVARALGSSCIGHWSGRGRWPAKAPVCDVAVVAVADPFVPSVAARLEPRLGPRCVLLHTSGAHGPAWSAEAPAPRTSARKLDPGRGARATRSRGVMHPLFSFATPRSSTLAGATAVIAGDARAVRASRGLAHALGLVPVVLALHGARYHAAAALVANGSAALAAIAVDSLVAQGMDRRLAERAISALLRSVAENVGAVGLPRALTGPIVRGDAAAVARHRRALTPRERRAYDAIAPAILSVALEAGLPTARARAIRAALADAPGAHQRSK